MTSQNQMAAQTTNENLNKFNSLFSQLQNIIKCGPDCQQAKEAQRLKQELDNAKSNVLSAPSQVQVAQKNFVTFTAGDAAYNDLLEKQLEQKALAVSDNYQEKYDEMVKKIKTQLETNEGILLNFKNIVDLYLKYKKDNAELFKAMKNTTNDILTNERKTYYQDQQVDVLKFYYYYFILTIYIISVFCFGVFSLIYQSQTSWKIRLATFIGLILLPFVSTWILGLLIYIIYTIYNLLPKNVYKGELDEITHYNYFKNI